MFVFLKRNIHINKISLYMYSFWALLKKWVWDLKAHFNTDI